MKERTKDLAIGGLKVFGIFIAIIIGVLSFQFGTGLAWSLSIKNTAIAKSSETFNRYAKRNDCKLTDLNEYLNYAEFTCSDERVKIWIP